MEEGDIVICIVDRIVGTNVFVKIEGEKREGTITLSEIAPGRIRNLRDYVFPNKKIVCKVLKVSNEAITLSLRRVTQKEKNEILEEANQEKVYEKIFKAVLKEKAEEILKKIKEKKNLSEFINEIKKDNKVLEEFVGKENSNKILEIIIQQKTKKGVVKKEVFLTTNSSNGLEQIKEAFRKIKGIEVKTISAGRYSLKKESEDLKKSDHELRKAILDIEEYSKKNGMGFSVKEK